MMDWLMEWYKSQCDGDWEHAYGIRIESLDNPGWTVKIDTVGTTGPTLSDTSMELHKVSDNDWYAYKVEGGRFDAAGDPSKLIVLITLFKECLEKLPDA